MKQSCERQKASQQEATAESVPSAGPDGAAIAPPQNPTGLLLEDMWVHSRSTQAADWQLRADTLRTDTHIVRGQERYLPHEAWHIVLQKQGRRPPARETKSSCSDADFELEHAAGVIEGKVRRGKPAGSNPAQARIKNIDCMQKKSPAAGQVVQFVRCSLCGCEGHDNKHCLHKQRPDVLDTGLNQPVVEGDLPADIRRQIVEHLDIRSLFRLQAVSKEWKRTVDDFLQLSTPLRYPEKGKLNKDLMNIEQYARQDTLLRAVFGEVMSTHNIPGADIDYEGASKIKKGSVATVKKGAPRIRIGDTRRFRTINPLQDYNSEESLLTQGMILHESTHAAEINLRLPSLDFSIEEGEQKKLEALGEPPIVLGEEGHSDLLVVLKSSEEQLGKHYSYPAGRLFNMGMVGQMTGRGHDEPTTLVDIYYFLTVRGATENQFYRTLKKYVWLFYLARWCRRQFPTNWHLRLASYAEQLNMIGKFRFL